MRDEAEVLFANDAFYNAFISQDIVALEALWASNSPVVCIHPGWPPLYGREAVMRSWTDILSSPNSPKIVCKDAKTHFLTDNICCLLYTSPSPRDRQKSRMPSSA